MADDAAPARRFIDAGVPVALGTDFNPGTSPTPNLPLVMTVACLEMRLSPAEALAAVTINAAYAAGIGDRPARSNPASRRTSWSGGRARSGSSRTGWAPTSSTSS